MGITLKQILDLVGKLDDSPGDGTSRERFRQFLKENVKEVGQLRDYIEECLRTSGEQYNRALQDLVNYLGRFLEFDVIWGRYQGVQGQVGFDGLWQSPTGFHMVVEVKTTEVYAIKTSTLVGYVDELICNKNIPDWGNALGLYVVGRTDPEINQLENAIKGEKRTHQLRVISVGSLLSLAEMMNEYDVTHQDILAILLPSGPKIDSIVDILSRLVAEEPEKEKEISTPEPPIEGEVAYWITPVKSDEKETAEAVVTALVGEENIYAFSERTPGRRHLKAGDWICFYATTKGIVAHAKVTTKPEKKRHSKVRNPEKYSWVFGLENASVYTDDPNVIDATLREKLGVFIGRETNKAWAWFVQATHKVSKHDFEILTRQK